MGFVLATRKTVSHKAKDQENATKQQSFCRHLCLVYFLLSLFSPCAICHLLPDYFSIHSPAPQCVTCSIRRSTHSQIPGTRNTTKTLILLVIWLRFQKSLHTSLFCCAENNNNYSLFFGLASAFGQVRNSYTDIGVNVEGWKCVTKYSRHKTESESPESEDCYRCVSKIKFYPGKHTLPSDTFGYRRRGRFKSEIYFRKLFINY